jgi:4-alpha-glucanotransferase
MSEDDAVRELARRAGIAVEWTNADNAAATVAVPVLRRILAALGLPAETPQQIVESGDRLAADEALRANAPLITATTDEPIDLGDADEPTSATASLVTESGSRRDVRLERIGARLRLPGISEPGYHALHLRDRVITLAVAPKRCFTPADIAGDARLWGIAVQLYGLRHAGDGGIGNTAGLSALARGAAYYGADAIGLSPTHAMFSADVGRYRPYSPSSRLFLNPLHADPVIVFGHERVAAAIDELALAERLKSLENSDLIDWPACAAAKLAILSRLFDGMSEQEARGAGDAALSFADFRRRGGELLEQHAVFEALHAARLAADPPCWNWRQWPAAWQDPQSAEVRAFAATNAREITFHMFLQWIADRSFAAAQAHAKTAGMRIGLIADLAVGTDVGGSDAWARRGDLLVGLSVGAPPDAFSPHGQNWALTTFSPRALVAEGFAPVIATLRAALRNAGGVRIDHAMGLRRLWLIPEGMSATEGAYLTYPFDDLVRLIKLESFRHRAVVIGEDLGTVPEGFREELDEAGVAGMRVLWFERDGHSFRPPQWWSPHAVATTTTHDLPTVAGWWRGADIDTRAQLGWLGPGGDREVQKQQRARDRALLWAAFRDAGVVPHSDPPANPNEVVDAAVDFIAATPSQLSMIPLEDMLGLPDQPNLPGTVDEHPNWCRRYPGDAGALFDVPQVRRRALSLQQRNSK